MHTVRNGLIFELALIALAVVLGLAAGALFRIYREKGLPWSQAGIAYAALWAVVIGSRLVFVYATNHSHSLDSWLSTERLTSDAITDGLLFMAVTKLVARTASLRVRALRLGDEEPEPQPAGESQSAPARAPASRVGRPSNQWLLHSSRSATVDNCRCRRGGAGFRVSCRRPDSLKSQVSPSRRPVQAHTGLPPIPSRRTPPAPRCRRFSPVCRNRRQPFEHKGGLK